MRQIYKDENLEVTVVKNNGQIELHRKFFNISNVEKFLEAVGYLQTNLIFENVTPIDNVIKNNDTTYTVVELLPVDQNLQDYLNTKRLSQKDATWVLKSILDVLNSAHSIALHGGIRPEFVWLDTNQKVAYLSSFSIDQPILDDHFSAPEVLNDNGLGVESDIYSIGALMYYAMTGKKVPNPIDVHKGLASFNKARDVVGLQNNWNNFIMRCLSYFPKDRFTSVSSLSSFVRVPVRNTNQDQQRVISPSAITNKNKLNK